MNPKIGCLTADTIRLLSADGVQKANSGHPGMPMGCADFSAVLWQKYLKFNPDNLEWAGRDRFILSAGHGSMLHYSLLHLYNCGMPMEELGKFRQWGSLTPGHPEYGETAGIEVTTGPLGSGFATAVGISMAQKYFAAVTGLDKTDLCDQKIYVISSDGCMMEGTTHEAAAIAGHLGLDNLVVFYDDNSITIEGETDLAFSEDVPARYRAYNWRVIEVDDGNDHDKLDKALAEARKSDGRPTMIVGKTKIGLGSPKEGMEDCHGAPLGEDDLKVTKKHFGFPEDEMFYVPAEVREYCAKRCEEVKAIAAEWDSKFQKFLEANPDKAALIGKFINKEVPANILEELVAAAPVDKASATRASSGTILQKAAELVPALFGGAADLAPSTKSNIKGAGEFSKSNYAGRNCHFGIRELGMGLCGNGMALSGLTIPYTSTFMVFSDYMKPAIRLAAIQKLHELYIFTHDSFFVGEDGPTHEPIEHLAMLRAIPGVAVLRPAEAVETAHAWAAALKADGPVVLALTRQNLEPLAPELAKKVDMSKGAYVLDDEDGFEVILIATGSEVNLALDSAKLLREQGKKVRVVSMPCVEYFKKQDKAYQDSVIPPSCKKRVTIEAGITTGWEKYAGDEGLLIGLDHFGASAPYKVLAEKFGFTPDQVASKVADYLSV